MQCDSERSSIVPAEQADSSRQSRGLESGGDRRKNHSKGGLYVQAVCVKLVIKVLSKVPPSPYLVNSCCNHVIGDETG